MSMFETYRNAFPNPRLTRKPTGVHILCPEVIGSIRGRYFLLALEGISAAQVARNIA